MRQARVVAVLVLALLAWPAVGTARERDRDRGQAATPLEQAREEAGDVEVDPEAVVPGGTVTVSPAQGLAARPGSRITVTLRVGAAARAGDVLGVRLPAAWSRVGPGGLRATRAPLAGGGAGERARTSLSNAPRTTSLRITDPHAGDTPTITVADVGMPAGTYRLGLTWNGRPAGSVDLVRYAPVREPAEGGPDTPLDRLPGPGREININPDAVNQNEAAAAVVPGDPSRMALGANQLRGTSRVYVSGNGGASWTTTPFPTISFQPGSAVATEAIQPGGDPALATDARGNIWYTELTLSDAPPSRIAVARIPAGTASFRPTAVSLGTPAGSSSDFQQDKELVAVDNFPASPHFGRIYVVWGAPVDGGTKLAISSCDSRPVAANCDTADHWSAPAFVTPAVGSYIYGGPVPAPDGSVYVTWWDYSSANAIAGRTCPASANCQDSAAWTAAPLHTVAALDQTAGTPLPFACPTPAQAGGRPGAAPRTDVDRTGRVWVAWGDLRTGSGVSKCDGGPSQFAGAATQLTWGAYVATAQGTLPGSAARSPEVATEVIPPGEGGASANSDDWFPWVSVDQGTDQAWVALHSTRLSADRTAADYYVRALYPVAGGGLDLGDLVRTSSLSSGFPGTFGICCGFDNEFGDYEGLAAGNGVALTAWTDHRAGQIAEQGLWSDVTAIAASPRPRTPGATTGTATAVGETTATLGGRIDAGGTSTGYRFDYGPTTGYGASTPMGDAGAGAGDTAVSAAVTGLAPDTAYHFRIVAVRGGAVRAAGADTAFRTAAHVVPPVTTTQTTPVPPDTRAPVVTRYSLRNRTFRVGTSATPPLAVSARRTPAGTTIRYTLSEAGTARIELQQILPGRRKGSRCVAPTSRLKKARRCDRIVRRGVLVRTSRAGANAVAFSGRVGRTALPAGSYRAVLVATDAARNGSRAATTSFTIVKK